MALLLSLYQDMAFYFENMVGIGFPWLRCGSGATLSNESQS